MVDEYLREGEGNVYHLINVLRGSDGTGKIRGASTMVTTLEEASASGKSMISI